MMPAMTHAAIGAELGLTTGAVQFIERRALAKLEKQTPNALLLMVEILHGLHPNFVLEPIDADF